MAFTEKRYKNKLLFTSLIIVLGCLIIFSSTIGPANISFLESLRIMLSKVPVVNNLISVSEIEKTHFLIVLQIRMPRIILSALIGAGLSVVGATFQAMFRNPMADPYVLGVSSGSALGAAIAMCIGLEGLIWEMGGTTLSAFAGSILTTLFVYNIARVGNKIPTVTLLLAGITISFFLSSIISMIMIFNRNQVERIVFWIMGSVSAASWKHIALLFPVIILGAIVIISFSRDLNVMAVGDETARSLGIEVEYVKKLLLIISSIIVASCVSVSGIIGFVGLIVPHAVRILLGPDHRTVLPFSAVAGAIFMIVCDTLARSLVPPAEIPVGAITSMFGAPYFIYLLNKSKKKVI